MPRSPRNFHQEVMQLYYDGKLTSLHHTPFYKTYTSQDDLPGVFNERRVKIGEELLITFFDVEYSAEIEVKFIAHGYLNVWEPASNFFRKIFRKLPSRIS